MRLRPFVHGRFTTCLEGKQINVFILKRTFKMLRIVKYFVIPLRLERNNLRCFSTEPKAFENPEKEKKFKVLELEIDVSKRTCKIREFFC